MTRVLAVLGIVLAALSAHAQEGGAPKLMVDFSLYPYQHTVKDDVDFTTTINAQLPGRFSYFGYVNTNGVVTDGSSRFVRSEQNLRYSFSEYTPLDFNAQSVLIRGDSNDFYQIGIGWRVHDTPGWQDFFERINLIYRITFQLRQFSVDDNSGWAMEHFFRMTFPNVSDRLYLSGFMDHSLNQAVPANVPSNPIVAEIQLGMRMFDRFYAISEYRINQKRVDDEYNFAVGIEYKFRW